MSRDEDGVRPAPAGLAVGDALLSASPSP